MAEERDQSERSEEPTQKRLDEAIRRGDVVKSQEVNTWFIIGAAALNLMIFSGSMGAGLEAALRGLIANAHAVAFDGGALMRLVARLGSEIIAAAAIPFLVLMAAAVAGNMIQHRFLWSTEPLRPALSKVSPAAGLKRLFSRQALVNFAKGIAKPRSSAASWRRCCGPSAGGSTASSTPTRPARSASRARSRSARSA